MCCFRMYENLNEDETEIEEKDKKRERVGEMVGSSEGLWDLHEMPFDIGNLFVAVITKSRKTGPLRLRCSKRLA